jgi:membrane protein YqaA with SNARE-associated domain
LRERGAPIPLDTHPMTITTSERRGFLAGPRRWVRALYDWTMRWADTPQSLTALFLIALAESSFFPIPPDVLLIAIVAANAGRWLTAAALCTAGSVAGAVVGYYIGAALMATVGEAIVEFYQAQKYWDQVVDLYQGPWGVWFLAAAAFTPIPYKVATIAAGATAMPFWPFVFVSILGRGARFFLVATILRVFGPKVRAILEKHFDLAALAFFVLLVGGFLVLKYL